MSRFVKILRGALALALCGAMGFAIGGCAGSSAVSKQAAGCDQPSEETSDETVVALLAQDGVDDLGVDGSGALDTVVDAAAEMEARVLVGNTGSSSQRVTIDTRLAPEGPNDLMRERALTCRTELVRHGYRQIAERPLSGEVDLLTALRNLGASLPTKAGEAVEVVVIGSALNTASADLRQRATRESPARSINGLARAGLNFRCEGWRAHLVGGALAPSGASSGAVDAQLKEWWRRYFDRCGGALVFYAPQLTEFPAGAEEVAAADRSLIPIHIERRGEAVEATLSGDVLFALGSAVLQADARSVLRRLLPSIAAAEGTIEVSGYTDSSGTEAVNGPLSERRARAVARWIEAEAGVPAGHVEYRGYGAADPVASNATELGRSKNRRVVVVLPGS